MANLRYLSLSHDPRTRLRRFELFLAKLVLRFSPPPRGGAKQKGKRRLSLQAELNHRLSLWESEQYVTLWKEALKSVHHQDPKKPVSSSHAANIRRARAFAEDAQFSKAVAALTSKGIASPSTETAEVLRLLHPEASLPTLPVLQADSSSVAYHSRQNRCFKL